MSSIRNVKMAGTLALSALAMVLATHSASAAGPQARSAQTAGDRGAQRRPQQRPERPERPARPERSDRRVPPDRPYTRETETTRTDTGFTRNTTVTNAEGQTATRNMTVVNDKDAGTHVVDIDRTGFDGRTSGVHHERQRTDDGFTRNSTITNRDGETATRNSVVTRNPETGTRTRDTSFTTFDGREGSVSDVAQRTEDGYTRDTTWNLPNGETRTRSVDVSCDKAAGKCVKEVDVNSGVDND